MQILKAMPDKTKVQIELYQNMTEISKFWMLSSKLQPNWVGKNFCNNLVISFLKILFTYF